MRLIAQILKRLNELERRQSNMLRIGTVAEVDATAATVRVSIGALLTAPLPWLTQRAGANARSFAAPSVGEQVLVLSPSGELAQGVALPALFQDAFPAPAGAENLTRTIYPDGTVVTYDSDAHKFTADIKGDADITTTGNATATIGGTLDASVTGDVTLIAAANVTAQVMGDLTAAVTGATNATLTGPATVTAAAALIVNAIGLVTITAASAVALTAASVAITAPAFALTGNLAVTGNITATGLISAGNPPVSLTTHNHGGSPPVAPS